jgi:Protein of unknown function (DUF1553)/Protein of unknown function (DUF1549)/Bacterial Ig-like domain (group 2)/Bacterial Ig-like domain
MHRLIIQHNVQTRWSGRLVVTSFWLAVLMTCADARSDSALSGFTVHPETAALHGNHDKLQLLVAGSTVDLTHSAQYDSVTPEVISVDSLGVVRAVGNGRGRVRISFQGQAREANIEVDGVGSNAPISFRRDVLPVLSKAGCNMGGCHGAQYGQGGFKLSLFGFDADADHEAILRDRLGRRVVFVEPDQSLVLRKPTGTVAHGGGRRLDPNSDHYRLLRDWIAQRGLHTPSSPDVLDLRVSPEHRVLDQNETQQLQVHALYRDGSTRDVTATAKYDTLNDVVASVDAQGLVTASGNGQTAIMVRYEGQAKVFIAVVPYARMTQGYDFEPNNFIDELVLAKWRELRLEPSPLASDAVFLRRVYLDALGTLPSPDEVRAFLKSNDSNKRSQVVDQLLGLTGELSPGARDDAFASYWALKWGDLLRNSRTTLGEQGMWSLHNWIRASLRKNRPVDEWVREILTAQGSTYSYGPANYFRVVSDPADLAETTAQVFLGIRLQCARCHQHPFERYSQADYYGMAAYFARVRTKVSNEFGIFGPQSNTEMLVYSSGSGEVMHPRTGEVMKPTPLQAEPSDDPVDRRRALARWLTAPENPWFARNIANRFWAYLLGVGLVDPIDDLRATNPPSNPELLDALAQYLVAHQFDVKQLLRLIMTSRVYQLSSEATPGNTGDQRFYTHYQVKRLGAEVLLDAVDFATGVPEKFPKLPMGTRAIALPDPHYASYFLDTMGRPKRVITCECERTAQPNLAQALHIANGDMINRKLADPSGRVTRLLAEHPRNEELIDELYLITVSRPPNEQESLQCQAILSDASTRREGAEDLLWALLNTKEFLFVH